MNKLSFSVSQDTNNKMTNDFSFAMFIINCLKRHLNNDFSECERDDAESNKRALEEGSRILNVFHSYDKQKIWIITEADRSITTVLFPYEY